MIVQKLKKELQGRIEILLLGPTLGDFSNEKALLSNLSPMAVILIDGGANYQKEICWENSTKNPILKVGDGDSYDGEMDLILKKEKDFSDLKFVLDLLPPSITKIYALGLLGGRRDHELSNFAEINIFLQKRAQPTVVDLGEEVRAFSAGNYEQNLKGTFSLFTFDKSQITLNGDCKYELKTPTLLSGLSSLGLSNEGRGKVSIQSQGPFFLFFPL